MKLAGAWVSGISDSYRIFKHNGNIATILVYFTEVGFSAFSHIWVHELSHQSVSLDNIFARNKIREIEEKLFLAKSDAQRIALLEKFLLSELKEEQIDKLIMMSIQQIYLSWWNIRIKELTDSLYISQSAFEKRFRKIVWSSPKQFSTIVRLNNLIKNIKDWTFTNWDLFRYGFFDQAHFIKSFKKHTWDTPEQFKRFL